MSKVSTERGVVLNELEKTNSPPISVKETKTNGNGLSNHNNTKSPPGAPQDPNAPELHKMYVDIHEDECFAEAFKKEKGIYVEVKHLESGDFAFSNVGIERKTLHDFYNSIVGQDRERLWRQVFNLKRCFDRPVLIIERWDDNFVADPKVYKTVWSSISTVTLLGITVITMRASSPKDFKTFVDFVSYMYYSSDKKTPSLRPVPKKSTKQTVHNSRSDMICMVPGIGRKRSEELLSKYHTIENLSKARREDLDRIVGKKAAELLLWILNGTPEELGSENNKQGVDTGGHSSSDQGNARTGMESQSKLS